MPDPEELPAEYASPPCFMHELTPEFAAPAGNTTWSDVARWRKAERERLIGERLTWSADVRAAKSETIARRLDEAVGKVANRIISLYWPFKGEPDLRNWLIQLIERGARIALPVVVEKNAPLEFRLWSPGEPLERGIWNILVPAHGAVVMPDITIAPLVGFDAANYRLGYGGGYFDRTLAAAPGSHWRSASAMLPVGSIPSIRNRTISRWTSSSPMNELSLMNLGRLHDRKAVCQ